MLLHLVYRQLKTCFCLRLDNMTGKMHWSRFPRSRSFSHHHPLWTHQTPRRTSPNYQRRMIRN